MAEKSRTEYSLKNARVAMFGKVLAIIFGYLSRIVFTRTVTAQIVSVNGLLFNITGALVMTNLGINTALVYAMYKPVKDHDEEKIRSLLKLYKKIFTFAALITGTMCMALYPFIGLLTSGQELPDNLLSIFLLFTVNTVVSYFDGYYCMVFLAEQVNYINEIFISIFYIIQNTLQMIVLVLSKDYQAYLVVYAACTLALNLATAFYAKKTHPWLKEKPAEPLEKSEEKSIVKNVKAMLMHKIGNTIIGSTDNLILTAMVSILEVGRYSNYYLITQSLRQVIDRGVQGITGSVGNLGASSDTASVKNVFEITLFTVSFLYGIAAIGITECLDTFVALSFGEQYVFTTPVVLVLALNFYLNGMRQAVLIFRDSLGLFWYDRYKTIVEALINLLTSIWLASFLGTIGVFIGTTISIISVSIWIEPYVLYRHYFKTSLREYFRLFFYYLIVTITAFLLCHWICGFISGHRLWSLLLRIVTVMAVVMSVNAICLHQSKPFQTVIRILKTQMQRKKRA